MKFTLMVRFKRPDKKHFERKPAAYGKKGVKPGWIEYKDSDTKKPMRVEVGNCSYDIRVEDKGTSYIPAGKNATDAEAKRLRMLGKANGRNIAEKAGLEVSDPDAETSKRDSLLDEFDDYIADAMKRNALEAMEQAELVSKEFLAAVKIEYVDEVKRDQILEFDQSLRTAGRSKRTIANKRQRLQSMLRWAGIDPKIFPPKPKYDKKLPTIYSQAELVEMFRVANEYQRIVCNLALKLGLRDQEVQFAEFTDISWEESVFRVRSKTKFDFTVKDYEERDIPIPMDFLVELKEWKAPHPKQNLIVPTESGRPNGKLLKMLKRLARGFELSEPAGSVRDGDYALIKNSSRRHGGLPIPIHLLIGNNRPVRSIQEFLRPAIEMRSEFFHCGIFVVNFTSLSTVQSYLCGD